MHNTQKRKLVSKRHGRRIIANNTAIDIAGSSKLVLDESIVNTSSEVSIDIDLHDDTLVDVTKDIAKVDIWNDTNKIYIIPTPSIHDDRSQNSSIQANSDEYNSIIKEVNNIDDNDNENDNENKLRNALATWAISHNITHNACNSLLKIFRLYTSYNIPTDVRTLLQTPRKTDILKVCGGDYFHSGLYDIIKKMLLKNDDKYTNLIINIDGLLLAKSSQASLWTILCSNTVNKSIYLVGAYFG